MTHAAPQQDVPRQDVDFQDYLELDTGEQRLEWISGHVYAMAGGTQRHNLMTGLIYSRLQEGALAKGCSPYVENRRLRTPSTGHYPDVMVVCTPPADEQYETDANLLVEVLSPSTQDVDRREKPLVYAGLPSFELYLLVDPDHVSIEVGQSRAGRLRWTRYGPGEVIDTAYGPLVVDELYASVDRVAVRKTQP